MTIRIHETASISKLADIEDSIRGSSIVIDAGVIIDSFVKIKAAGGDGDIYIGANVVINSGCVLYIGNGITIGANSMIAANVTLAPTNHEFSNSATLIRSQGFAPSKGGILIGEDVWIGSGCIILDGSRIGKGAVIGAASLVSGVIPDYSVGFGIPYKNRYVRGGESI